MATSKSSTNSFSRGLTFDDILLLPRRSALLPKDAVTASLLTASIRLNIPFLSAAMDTVTEVDMARAMALQGGIGVIHKNLSAEEQAKQVARVKHFTNLLIEDPITVEAGMTIRDVTELIARRQLHFSSFPVLEGNKLVGFVGRDDMRFQPSSRKVRDVMVPRKELVVLRKEDVFSKGRVEVKALKRRFIELFHAHKKKTVPVIGADGLLVGVVCAKDMDVEERYPAAALDKNGKLLVAAAVGVGEEHVRRAELLVKSGVDALVIDTAHGHSEGVIAMTRTLKKRFGTSCQIIAGNIATAGAARALIEAGADAVKVGIGPGSICTTRVVAGVGVPQVTAIMDVRRAINASKRKVCLIADGGVKYSGDVAKAIAAGADCVMLGGLLAGCSESPGDEVLAQGKRFKSFRGMGSLGAMRSLGGRERYGQAELTDEKKMVPEGIEGMVPFKGPVSDVLYQLNGGLKASMGYCGVRTVPEFKGLQNFVTITGAGLRESHPHDVTITKEAPNYTR